MFRPVRPSTNQKRPQVEIVVPCYNYGRFLVKCVESVTSQHDVETSVHIVDDASTDDSYSVALDLASHYPNVRVSRNTVNIGHIDTYNRGLREVSAEYLVLLSADDLLAPGSLGRATALMETHSNVGLVYGHPRTFETEPGQDKTAPPVTWSVWQGKRWIRAQFRRGLSIIYSPEAVVRTSVQRQVGLYRPELPHSGDLEMWLRIAHVADIGRVNGPDQAYRRIHQTSMMNTRFKGVLTDLQERQRAYEAYLDTPGLESIEVTNLSRVMRKRLAAEALGWAIDEATNYDDVTSAIVYARKVHREFHSLPAWRELQKTRLLGSHPDKGQWDHFRRDLGNRIRWQRWRRLGI